MKDIVLSRPFISISIGLILLVGQCGHDLLRILLVIVGVTSLASGAFSLGRLWELPEEGENEEENMERNRS